jgi:hypothetical protein
MTDGWITDIAEPMIAQRGVFATAINAERAQLAERKADQVAADIARWLTAIGAFGWPPGGPENSRSRKPPGGLSES